MYTWFSKIGPSGLAVLSDLGLIEINILTKFHEVWIKTVPSRVLTSFSKIGPSDLVYNLT